VKNFIKKNRLAIIIIILGVLLISQLNISFKSDSFLFKTACAVAQKFHIYINGKHAGDMECQSKKDIYLLPLSFPFKSGETKWEVIIKYNQKDKKVEVKKIHHAPEELLPTRTGEDEQNLCRICTGSGKCQSCVPKGTGYSWYEGSDPCIWCNGTGKCYYCNGSGKW